MDADLSVQGISKDDTFRLDGKEFVLPYKSRLITNAEVEKIRSLEGVNTVSPTLLIWNFNSTRFNTIAGVDDIEVGPARSLAGTIIKQYEFDSANQRYLEKGGEITTWMSQGRFFEMGERGVAVLESHYAYWYKLGLGDSITLGTEQFEVIGIVDIKEGSQIAASNIYLPLQDARQIMGIKEGANVVFIKADDASNTKEVTSYIQEEIGEVEISSSDTILQLMGGMAAIADKSAYLASLVAFVGAGLFIFKTTSESMLVRTRDMGVLKAIGWTGANIRGQVLTEVIMQCMLGWILGVLLGYVSSQMLGTIRVSVPVPLSQVPAFVQESGEVAQAIRLLVEVEPTTIILSAMVTLVISGMTGLLLTQRVMKMKPADALLYR